MSLPTIPDHDVVELVLEFGGLSISVRGSTESASSFVRGLIPGAQSAPPASLSPPCSSFSRVSVAASDPGPPRTPIETRRSIEDSFPACPSNWIRAGRTLSAIGTTGEERVTRAWVAGCWAKAVLDNRIGSPNRSSACRLQNRFWVVLFCQGLEVPRVFTSSRAFFAAVGRVEGSDTLCHGFASATEAETYLEAAGFAFPLSLN